MQTPYIPQSKSHIHIPSLESFIQRIRPGPRLVQIVRNKFIFYSEVLSAPRQTPKLEDHLLSFVLCCLFIIFTGTLYPQPKATPCCSDRDPVWQRRRYIYIYHIEEILT
jgi:hypothetical protein